jgi:hypothetical protein
MFISGMKQVHFTRAERIKRGLMVVCAVVLFVLGIFLLVEPLRAGGAEPGKVMDNVGGTAATSFSCA